MKKLTYEALFLASFVFIGTQGALFCMDKNLSPLTEETLKTWCCEEGLTNSGPYGGNTSSSSGSDTVEMFPQYDGEETPSAGICSDRRSGMGRIGPDFFNEERCRFCEQLESSFFVQQISFIVDSIQDGPAVHEQECIKEEITTTPFYIFANEAEKEIVCDFVSRIVSKRKKMVQNKQFEEPVKFDQVRQQVSYVMTWRLAKLVYDEMHDEGTEKALELLGRYSQEVKEVLLKMGSLKKEVSQAQEMPASGSRATLDSPATIQGPGPSLPGASSIGDLAD